MVGNHVYGFYLYQGFESLTLRFLLSLHTFRKIPQKRAQNVEFVTFWALFCGSSTHFNFKDGSSLRPIDFY